MELLKFRVTKFRSVQDSGWIDVDKITEFIGTNESGKTNILLPLWKLNPSTGGEIDEMADVPRSEYHQYHNNSEKPIFIKAVFQLTKEEKDELVNLTNIDPGQFETVEISKNYAGEFIYAFPNLTVESKTIKNSINNIFDESKNSVSDAEDNNEQLLSIINEAKEAFNSSEELLPGLKSAKEILGNYNASGLSQAKESLPFQGILEEINNQIVFAQNRDFINNNPDNPVLKKTESFLPRFVYYSNYGNLDSRIYLPDVIKNFDKKEAELRPKDISKVRTLKTLFKFINLDPKEILSLGSDAQSSLDDQRMNEFIKSKDERQILLDSAATDFTKKFNEWWKQGDYIFYFVADGNFFHIWVSDKQRPEKIELESRSTGLQWFFSFYLIFLVEAEGKHKNAVLLLDEPGLTLHPNAQKDLFKFFDNLSTKNQLLYTTHSPFMVDANNLDRVRAVFINKDGYTEVSSDLRAAEKEYSKNQIQAIYPAHAALGLSVSDTLLLNCQPIIVEGVSDQYYLMAIKNLLISKGKIMPRKELVFIPAGGVKNIKVISGIVCGKNEKLPFVIIDGDKPAQNIKKQLTDSLYKEQESRIIDISDFNNAVKEPEIEDMFPRDKFVELVDRFLTRPEEAEVDFKDYADNKTPICNVIEDYAKHYGLDLLQRGWKVKLAKYIKNKVLKTPDKVLSNDDPELDVWTYIFMRICDK